MSFERMQAIAQCEWQFASRGCVRIVTVAGQALPLDHYSIPPLDRVDLDEIRTLIQLNTYFVVRAPRQSGKTSMLPAPADRLQASGKYRCVYVNFEVGEAAGEDTQRALRTLIGGSKT